MNVPSVIMATSMGVATKPISDQSLTFINDLDTTGQLQCTYLLVQIYKAKFLSEF